MEAGVAGNGGGEMSEFVPGFQLVLEDWVKQLSSEDAKKLMDSFSSPDDFLTVTAELRKKYGAPL